MWLGRLSVATLSLWEKCLDCLQDEFPLLEFNTWIRPLQVEHAGDKLVLFAPNRFVRQWINDRFLGRISELVAQYCDTPAPPTIFLEIGSKSGGASVKEEVVRI